LELLTTVILGRVDDELVADERKRTKRTARREETFGRAEGLATWLLNPNG
jgi:hypothetical protein